MTPERMREAAQLLGEFGNGKMANELIAEVAQIERLQAELAALRSKYDALASRLVALEQTLKADAAHFRHYLEHYIVHVPVKDERGYWVNSFAAVQIPDWAVKQRLDDIDAAINAPTALPDTPQAYTPLKKQVCCRFCDAPYGEDGWCDVIIPDKTWNEVFPYGGVVCFRCMTKKIEAAGLHDVPVNVVSGPYVDANEKWRLIGFDHGVAVTRIELASEPAIKNALANCPPPGLMPPQRRR